MRKSAVIVLVMLLGTGIFVPFPVEAMNLNSTISYLQTNVDNNFQGMLDWPILALAGAGEDVSRLIRQREQEVRQGEMFLPQRSTDYQRTVLAAVAAGKDPRSFGGYNLVEAIKGSQLPSGKFADTINGKGENLVNAHIWGIISLYAAGESIPDQAGALAWLAEQQNADGGYSIDTAIKSSDIDITGMALIAFGALGQDQNHPAVKKALAYLQKQQQEDGGFVGWGGSSVESIAQVIQGLTMLGIDPTGSQWTQAQGNPVTAMLSYRQQDGSFSRQAGEKGDIMATYQALIALGDYERGESIYQVLRRRNLRFPDLPPGHYAAVVAGELVARGIITGYPDGTFRPENAVKRQEFACMIVAVAGKEQSVGSLTTAFIDVPAHHWANPYIRVVVDAGLMIGKGQNKFAPEDTINGAEVAAILVRVLTGERDVAVRAGEPWYGGFVRLATKEGLLYPNFDPMQPASRGQCVYSISKLLKMIES
ncbi:MAG: S-layer homology domain-containing protein [bacterium]